jgi:serine/threonine-protein kinase/endoribonuclease IRE1
MYQYSLGCHVFYCITKGKHPFCEYYEWDVNIANNRFDLFMVDYIPEAVHLISHLLEPNPEAR